METKNPINWPLVVKVPLFVVVLMVGVSVAISQVVLSRLEKIQEQSLADLSAAYLDGLSTAIVPFLVRQDVWETYDALSRAEENYLALKTRYTVVTLPDGTILAASDPARFPVDSTFLSKNELRVSSTAPFEFADEAGLVWIEQAVVIDGITLGTIFAEIDLSAQLGERQEVLLALVLVNGSLIFVFAAAGYVAVRKMMQPVAILRDHLERQNEDNTPLPIAKRELEKQGPEFRYLFRRFNTMVAAIRQRESLSQRLAEEEKLALIGKLASGVAHEVNNPLGGMMNAVDTIKMHGDDPMVRETSLGLIERGLQGIRDVVRAALVTYKGSEERSDLSHTDIEDLRYLIQNQAAKKNLTLDWQNNLPESMPIQASAIRQVCLNLLLNACQASPLGSTVRFVAQFDTSKIVLRIVDSGTGLPDDMRRLYDVASKEMEPPKSSKGLGIWSSCRLVYGLRGVIDVTSKETGTEIEISLPLGNKELFDAVA